MITIPKLLCLLSMLWLVGCGTSDAVPEADKPEAAKGVTNGVVKSKKPKGKLQVRWTPYTPGVADAAVVRDKIVVVNFGSADAGGNANSQFAANDSLLEQDDVQDLLVEVDAAIFHDQVSVYHAPRGLDKADFVAGDNQAVLLMYTYKTPYKPTMIDPPTVENLAKMLREYRSTYGRLSERD